METPTKTPTTSETPFNASNILLPDEFVTETLRRYGIAGGFKSIDIYRCAMVHKSYCTRKNENFFEGNASCPRDCIPLQEESNERLEFLGDSVLSVIVATYLYERYPDSNEGFLTQLRTKIVNGKMLANLSKHLGLQPYVLVSKQIEQVDGRNVSNILEDAFEAFLGALYIDMGFLVAQEWLINFLEEHLDFCDLIRTNTNYKDMIIKHYQHTFGYIPKFYEMDIISTANNQKTYKICLKDKNDHIISIGFGSNKKEAENDAANKALKTLKILA